MPDRDLENSPFGKALKGVNLNPDSLKKPPQYKLTPDATIKALAEEDFDAAIFLRMKNYTVENMKKQAEGVIPREKVHNTSWIITIETPEGNIGLRNPHSGVGLGIRFPKDAPGTAFVIEDVIKDTLGIENAKPVQLEHGGKKKFASFYGPPEPTGGRVWFEDSTDIIEAQVPFDMRLFTLQDGKVVETPMSAGSDRYINTVKINAHSEKMPEGPTKDPKAIQRYRDKFIDLASKIAFFMGGAKSITVNFEALMTPEDLVRENYRVKERDGNPEIQETYVIGKKGDATVVLNNSKNQIVWATYLRIPTAEISSPKSLAETIKEDILHF